MIIKDLLRFVLQAVIFRWRRSGFRHLLLESGEENNPDNPACLAEASARRVNPACPVECEAYSTGVKKIK